MHLLGAALLAAAAIAAAAENGKRNPAVRVWGCGQRRDAATSSELWGELGFRITH